MVWTVQDHLYVDFFQYLYCFWSMVESLQMWRADYALICCRCRGQTIRCFYAGNLSIHKFWYLWQSWNQFPMAGGVDFSISLPLIGTDFTSENSDLKAKTKQNKAKTFVLSASTPAPRPHPTASNLVWKPKSTWSLQVGILKSSPITNWLEIKACVFSVSLCEHI